MTRFRRLVLLLVTALPVLALLTWSLVYLRQQVNQLAGRAHVLIADELQRRFEKQVSVGSTRISPGVIVLEDIRVAKGKTFADGTILSIPRLFIHYSWRDAVFGGKGASAIRDVVVMRPRVLLVRRPDGSFNINDLLKPPPGPRRQPFAGLIKINHGEVEFRDYAVTPGRPRGPIFARDVNGVLSAADHPVYTFHGKARGGADQFAGARFDGRYYSTSRRAVVEIQARGVSAPLVMPYAWRSRTANVSSGKLDISAVLDQRRVNRHYAISINGRVNVRNATISSGVLRSPATDIDGLLILSGNDAVINIAGNAGGSPLRVRGSIKNLRNPALDLSVSSAHADFARLIRTAGFLGALSQFSPSGRGPANARITGSLASPVADVTATIPRAVVRGVPVSNVAVSALYRRGRVDLRSVRFSAKGADLAARGYVTTGPGGTMLLTGRFSGFDLRSLPRDITLPVTGVAGGTFSLSGRTASPTVTGTVRVARGSVSGTPFGSAEAKVRLAGSAIKVSSLRVAGLAGGALQAYGTVTPRSVDLVASAASIDIAAVAGRFGETGYGGTAFFNGRITGSPRSPEIKGQLEAFEVTANGRSIDHVLIAFSGNRHSATINEGVVRMFPAEARFTGELTGLDQNRVSFSGKANVQRLEVVKLLDLIDRRAKVTGTILADVTFSGVFLPHARKGSPRVVGVVASGNMSLEDATAFEHPISSASATLDYSNNVLRVSNASVVSDKARLDISGTLATDTYEVKAGFDLTGFELARLQDYLGEYAVLAGVADATGTVSGTWDDLNISVNSKASALAINYERFDGAEAQVTYSGGKYASYSASLSRGSQRLVLSGSGFDPETACLTSVKGTVADVSVPDIWAILRASPYFSTPRGKPLAQKLDRFPKIVTGRVNGSFNLTGCLEAPDGSVVLSATNIGLDVEKIESIDLEASSKSGVVTIGALRAVSGDMTLDVAGAPAYDNGNLDMEIRAENVNLSRLGPWLGDRTPAGTLSALFAVRGPASAPDVRGSVEIVKPGYAGMVLDQLRAGSIEITASRIEIPDILLTAGGYQATASASVPWSWDALAVPRDEPVSMAVDLSSQNLAMLNALGPIVDTTRTTGTISEAWFRLEGTLLDPQLAGAVKVNNGVVALNGFTNTFTNVNVDVAFVSDRLVVNSLSAASSLGGSVYIAPGGYITAGILAPSEVNLQLVADRLRLAERNALGLREDVTAQVDAGLAVTGPLTAPLVADRASGAIPGGITLSRSKLAFQLVSKGSLWQAKPPINPAFDVSLRLGQDVVVSPPSMSIAVTGAGTLTGTLAQPVVRRMALDVLSGDIGLATARLRIIPGGHIYITYAPPDPPDVQVDLQATASVFAVNALRQRQRYQITMMITGQAANPRINLSSSPPGLSREQMLAGLGHLPSLFTSPEDGLQEELASVLTAAGAQALFAPIENLFIQKLGFEQFSLEFSPQYPLSIYASRHLFGNYYLSFYRQLRGALASTQDTWYKVTLSYRKGMYEFSVGADDEQTLSTQIGYAKAFW